jgi:hypothetical protein
VFVIRIVRAALAATSGSALADSFLRTLGGMMKQQPQILFIFVSLIEILLDLSFLLDLARLAIFSNGFRPSLSPQSRSSGAAQVSGKA